MHGLLYLCMYQGAWQFTISIVISSGYLFELFYMALLNGH